MGVLATLVLVLLVFGLPVGRSLALLLQGSLTASDGLAPALVRWSPLLLTSLGVIVAWKAGQFNIGGEGQYVVGGLVGALVARLLAGIPGQALNPIVLIGSALGGGAYAFLAGWLYVRRGVQIVISTILLNFIALQLLDYCVTGPLQEAARKLPQTDALPPDAMLMRWNPQSDLHVGVFFGPVLAILITFLLYSTSFGLRLRVVGSNPRAARANRVPVERTQLIAMAISGALCGLAAGIEFTARTGKIGIGFSQNWGFLAIPVALIGGLSPIGAILAAFFFAALFAGGENLERFTPQGSSIILIIQAIVVFGLLVSQSLQKQRKTRPAPEASS